MEIVKNIFFNTDKIVENTEVKVTYAGKLFQNGSENVTMHYGYENNWTEAKDVVMEKTALGYQANITIGSYSKLNFCFKNSNGNWDNNEGTNYEFAIEKACTDPNLAENIEVEGNINPTEEAPLVAYQTPSWGELFKRTFNNFVNYFAKLFGKNTNTVNTDNNN